MYWTDRDTLAVKQSVDERFVVPHHATRRQHLLCLGEYGWTEGMKCVTFGERARAITNGYSRNLSTTVLPAKQLGTGRIVFSMWIKSPFVSLHMLHPGPVNGCKMNMECYPGVFSS